MTPKNARFFYLIATYGKKPTANITRCPAVSIQIANMRRFSPHDDLRRDYFMGDYARKINRLDDLPILKATLDKSMKGKVGVLIVDDICRIFRICSFLSRADLFEELRLYGDCLISLRQKLKLSEFSADQSRDVVLNAEKSRYGQFGGARKRLASQVERADATEEARIASIASRQSAAIKRGRQIIELEDQMKAAGQPHSSADLATEANARGLRTSRDLPWTARSVRDVIRLGNRQATE